MVDKLFNFLADNNIVISGLISWIFVILGSFVTLTSLIGIRRMPDLYTKFQASGIAESLGAPMILIGIAIQHGFSLTCLKIIFLILFIQLTAPISTYAIGQAALKKDLKPLGQSKDEN